MVAHGKWGEVGTRRDECIRPLGRDLMKQQRSELGAEVRSQDGHVVFAAALRGEHMRFPVRRQIGESAVFRGLGPQAMANLIGGRLMSA